MLCILETLAFAPEERKEMANNRVDLDLYSSGSARTELEVGSQAWVKAQLEAQGIQPQAQASFLDLATLPLLLWRQIVV